MKAGLGAYFERFPQLSVTPKRVIAQGDLVAVHSHCVDAPGERGRAVIDLFRVRDGRIVEHWDAVQDVPETAANDNTMFWRPLEPPSITTSPLAPLASSGDAAIVVRS